MQLALALDLAKYQDNLKLCSTLASIRSPLWIKVGLRSFIRDGVPLLKAIRQISGHFKIFLDLKLYDIPNTMADAAQSCFELGVDMITLHTSSGKEGMDAVMQRLEKLQDLMQKKRPLVFGVTALTSFDDSAYQKIYHQNIQASAKNLAQMAYESGLDGVVCSVFESLEIKRCTADSFLTLTPAIRPFHEESHDQKRIATLAEAKKHQADFIVIGRPIYQAADPLQTTLKILKEMER